MSDSPFDPPTTPPATQAKAALALDGNGLPNPMDLGKAVLTEFMDDIGPYALAGVGTTLVGLVAGILLVTVAFGCFFGGMFASLGVGAGLASAGGDTMEAVGGAVAPIGVLLSYLGLILVVVVGGAILTAPFNGSLVRGIDNHRRGIKDLGFHSAFDTALQQPVKDILTTLVFQLLVLLGLPFFYIGALIVVFFLKWMPLGTYLDGHGPMASAKNAVGHSKSNLSWHLGIFGVGLLFGLVGGNIPVLGPMATSLFWVRSYRAVFPAGDEADPQAEVLG